MRNAALDMGDRVAFLNILTVYGLTADRSEHSVIDALYQLVSERSDCFERYREDHARHIATSVFLMDDSYERALYLWNNKISVWAQPGGHADGDSNIYRVAQREVLEEVDVSIEMYDFLDPVPFDIVQYDFPASVFGYAKTIFNLFFLARIPAGQHARNNEPGKCREIRFVNPQEARSLVGHDPVEVRLIEKWEKALARLRARL